MKLTSWMHPDATALSGTSGRQALRTGAIALCGLGIYGFTMGYWRDPVMGLYTAVKLPLVVACTLTGNGLLNSMIGMLLGSQLSSRQTLLALLSAFAIAGVLLASLAPVVLMLSWSMPPPHSAQADDAHAALLVIHTGLIAFAGTAANAHLYQILLTRSANTKIARLTLAAWLAGNGFLGTQFSWIFRPFFGTPSIRVEFLRESPLHGNFYQAFWHVLDQTTGGHPLPAIIAAALLMTAWMLHTTRNQPTPPHEPDPTTT